MTIQWGRGWWNNGCPFLQTQPFYLWSHWTLCKNVNVICLPTEHQGVHKNSFWNVRAFQDRIGIWKCWFLRRGENRSTRRKTSQSRVENQQKTQPTYDARSGNRTWDTLVGGEPYHHYAIPAPQWDILTGLTCLLLQYVHFNCSVSSPFKTDNFFFQGVYYFSKTIGYCLKVKVQNSRSAVMN